MNTITSGTTSTSLTYNMWGMPERVEVNEYQDHIEMIFKETSNITYTVWPPRPSDERCYKIIFSCVDGKWNKSEPIYGKIISAQPETYEFE